MTGLTLDAGALIALERGDRRVAALLQLARETSADIAVPAGALAQVWRDGARQASLSRLVRSRGVDVVPLDATEAKLAGQLCGASGQSDIVDASVVLCARRRRHRVLTSDPGDLRRLDPKLPIVIV